MVPEAEGHAAPIAAAEDEPGSVLVRLQRMAQRSRRFFAIGVIGIALPVGLAVYVFLLWQEQLTELQRGIALAAGASLLIGALSLRWGFRNLRRYESLLRETHDLLQSVVEGTSDEIFVKDLAGRYQLVNAAAAARMRRSVAAIVGRTDAELFGPEPARLARARDQEALEAGYAVVAEFASQSTGVQRTYSSVRAPYRNARGRVLGVIGITRDVTDLRAAEEKVRAQSEDLLRSAALLRAVIDSNPDAVFAKDREGRYLLINRAGAARFGLSPEQFVGRYDIDLLPFETAQDIRSRDLKVMATGNTESGEFVATSANSELVVSTLRAPLYDGAGKIIGVTGIARNVTERVHTERTIRRQVEQLRQVNELLQAVIQGTSDAVWVKDRDGRYLLANPAAAAEAGCSATQMVGRSDLDLFDADTAAIVQERDRHVMSSGQVDSRELEFNMGGRRAVFSTLRAPYRDADGKIIGTIGVSRDITAYKEAEAKAALQQQELERCTAELLRRSGIAPCTD